MRSTDQGQPGLYRLLLPSALKRSGQLHFLTGSRHGLWLTFLPQQPAPVRHKLPVCPGFTLELSLSWASHQAPLSLLFSVFGLEGHRIYCLTNIPLMDKTLVSYLALKPILASSKPTLPISGLRLRLAVQNHVSNHSRNNPLGLNIVLSHAQQLTPSRINALLPWNAPLGWIVSRNSGHHRRIRGRATRNLFASKENTHCPLFLLQDESTPLRFDALAHQWLQTLLYALLPVALIQTILACVPRGIVDDSGRPFFAQEGMGRGDHSTVEWETLARPCAQGPTLSSPGTDMAPMTRNLGSVRLAPEKGETDGFRITGQCY